MFEAKHASAATIKAILEICRDVSPEMTFNINREGITTDGFNSTRVSILKIRLQREFFTEFRCDRSIAIGVSLVSLLKMFKYVQSDATVQFRVDDKADILALDFESPSKPGRSSTYELRLLDLDFECYEIPEIKYTCVADFSSIELIQAMKDHQTFGDTVSINCNDKSITMSVDGDLANASTKLKPVTMLCTENVNMSFSLKYLLWFAKCTRFSRELTLSVGTDLPLELKCYSKNTFAEIRYYVAGKDDN